MGEGAGRDDVTGVEWAGTLVITGGLAPEMFMLPKPSVTFFVCSFWNRKK